MCLMSRVWLIVLNDAGLRLRTWEHLAAFTCVYLLTVSLFSPDFFETSSASFALSSSPGSPPRASADPSPPTSSSPAAPSSPSVLHAQLLNSCPHIFQYQCFSLHFGICIWEKMSVHLTTTTTMADSVWWALLSSKQAWKVFNEQRWRIKLSINYK